MHIGDPVAQRVHDQLQHVRLSHVQRVAGAGVVHVIALVVLHQPVVRRVVDAAEGQHRTLVVAFRGVVVDDVEDHFHAGGVQRLDHGLELLHLLAVLAGGAVGAVRRQESDGVVAPVVGQSVVDQMVVLHELVHRHQLHRSDAELAQVIDHGGMRQAGIGAADLGRDPRVVDGQTLDVGLVDDALVVRRVRVAVVLPVEERVDDNRLHHVRAAVKVVAVVRRVELVAEQGLVPVDLTLDRLGVGVEQQLRRVAPVPVRRVVGTVHPEAVALTRAEVAQVAMPDEGVDLGQLEPSLAPGRIEQAELHPVSHLGEQSEVRADAVVRRAQRVRRAGPDLHGHPAADFLGVGTGCPG